MADLLDQYSLIDLMRRTRPDEVYNLAAMSFVPAMMCTTRGRSATTSWRKRASICGLVWPPMPRPMTPFVKNAASDAEREKFRRLVDLFRKYGDEYQLDYLLMAAQGYQESRLDQRVKSPVGAIGVDKGTGARVVDEAKCIGCGTCQKACPWGMATVDPEKSKSTKCVLCYGDPQCAKFCPNGALKFVPWDEAVKQYKAHWETHV